MLRIQSGRFLLAATVWWTFSGFAFDGVAGAAEPEPLTAERQAALNRQFDEEISRYTARLKQDAQNLNLYSARGDAHFFRGRFPEAVADYEKMVQLDPAKESDHWRKGIAYFYAGRYEDAAHQFEVYHNFDDVDRENGIWRFFSQAKAYSLERAREGLLKYKKDDREPFPAIYELFAGKREPDQVLVPIREGKLSLEEQEKRLFYAELYVGLNYAIEQKPDLASKHLAAATANSWGPRGGYGPSYMWNVGRLHYDLLKKERRVDKDGARRD